MQRRPPPLFAPPRAPPNPMRVETLSFHSSQNIRCFGWSLTRTVCSGKEFHLNLQIAGSNNSLHRHSALILDCTLESIPCYRVKRNRDNLTARNLPVTICHALDDIASHEVAPKLS